MKNGAARAKPAHSKPAIGPDMTILDIVSRYGKTEAVFKRYDHEAGICLCCQALFDSLKDAAGKYRLDINRLIADLNAVIDIEDS